VNGVIPSTDAYCTNNGSGVLYVCRDINSICVIGTVEFIIQHVKTYSFCFVVYVVLKNKVMRVIVYRLVLFPHIRETLL
jgi:hypothetical protein